MKAQGRVLAGGALGARWLSQFSDSDADAYLAQRGTVVKSDANSQAWLVEFEAAPCFAKLYRHKSPLRRLLPAATARRPLRAFRMAHALHGEGLAVARPLCCVALPGGALLLTEALANRDSLAAQWPTLPEREQGDCLALAARSLAALHRAGYSHGDCKWHNLLVVEDTCYLLDLDCARRDGGRRGRARDIARFTVGAEEAGVGREQFDAWLEQYLSCAGPAEDGLLAAASRYARVVRRRHERRYAIVPRPLL